MELQILTILNSSQAMATATISKIIMVTILVTTRTMEATSWHLTSHMLLHCHSTHWTTTIFTLLESQIATLIWQVMDWVIAVHLTYLVTVDSTISISISAMETHISTMVMGTSQTIAISRTTITSLIITSQATINPATINQATIAMEAAATLIRITLTRKPHSTMEWLLATEIFWLTTTVMDILSLTMSTTFCMIQVQAMMLMETDLESDHTSQVDHTLSRLRIVSDRKEWSDLNGESEYSQLAN